MAVEIAGRGRVPERGAQAVVRRPLRRHAGGLGRLRVSPDGSASSLYEQAIDPGEAGELILVLNWFDELERLVPVE